jgi:hypothetical protein
MMAYKIDSDNFLLYTCIGPRQALKRNVLMRDGSLIMMNNNGWTHQPRICIGVISYGVVPPVEGQRALIN